MQSFVSIRFSQHDRTVLHVIQRAHAQALLHLPHNFFGVKVFSKSSQLLSPNLTKALLVLAPDMLFSSGDWRPRKRKKNAKGGEVCKVVSKSMPRKTFSKRGLDRSQMEQPIKKNKFSYLARSRLRLRPREIWERD